ncbi:hypothetical protein WUBG_09589, partial [Wuchereria bancrofti]
MSDLAKRSPSGIETVWFPVQYILLQNEISGGKMSAASAFPSYQLKMQNIAELKP